MTVFVCLDERGGMRFNRRRQSRDAAVLEDIRRECSGTLLADPCSAALLEEAGLPWSPAPRTLPREGWFFAEDRSARELADAADVLVIYRWNRHYPSDVRWDVDPEQAGFTLNSTRDFPGRSHETITKEVYAK